MAVIDTTLDFFKIPGIDTFTHLFGTKKPSGKGLTTEEVANNIAAGFMKQRPYVVTETSNTQRIDANSLFLITANDPAYPIVLTLGTAAFIGCEISVINKSDVEHNLNATYSGSTLGTVTLPAKSKMSLIWAGDGWIILDSQKINNNEFASALSPKDLPAIEAMNFGENSGYIKWTNGLLVQWINGVANPSGTTLINLPIAYTRSYTPVGTIEDAFIGSGRWSVVGGTLIVNLQQVKIANHSSNKMNFHLLTEGV